MSKKVLTLAFYAALAVFTTTWLSGAAQAGPTAVCGDSTIDPPETCDDGNTVSGDGCSGESCLDEVCGDSIVNPDPAPGPEEECDDGNTVDDDGCTAGTTPNCQFDCGDGEIDAAATPAEVCDDGNATNGDGCDDDPSATSPGNCTATACGNGVITAPETCDDGNTTPDDGCDATCQTEADVPQTKKQQGCINAVNKNLAGVAKAQGGEISKCVKDTASGKVADELTCLVDGPKTVKAGEKTTKTITGKKCTGEGLATLALTDAATVNGAGSDQVLEGTTVILGADPTIALKSADKEGAKCQAEAVKQYNAVVGKWLSAANKAKKSTLKGGKGGTPPPAGSAADLATGIDAGVAADTALGKAVTKVGTGLGKKCTDAQVDALFDCGGATTVAALTTCVSTEAQRAACEALEAADGLDLTCL